MAQISETELILNPDGNHIYHLHLLPGELADNIILVGDPDRVAFFSALLDDVELRRQNREYVTHTGTYKGTRITILSSGIGTGNIDIVMNEIDALANVDFATRLPKSNLKSLNIVRIGTSGAIQPEIPPGNCVLSSFTVGMDNLLNYYNLPHNTDEAQIHKMLKTSLPEGVDFYICQAEKMLLDAFPEDIIRGITCVAPGFYAPQNRQLRARVKHPHLFDSLQNFSYQNLKITNLEMEASAIYGLGRVLNHHCCTIDLILANRVNNNFLHDYKPKMLELGKLVLETFVNINSGSATL